METHIKTRDFQVAIDTLSRREREAAELLVQGFTITKIAKLMRIQYTTCNDHIKAIYKKLGINRGEQLAGLIPQDDPNGELFAGLKAQHLDVLLIAGCGKKNQEIANILNLTRSTVHESIMASFKKSGIRSRDVIISTLAASFPSARALFLNHYETGILPTREEMNGVIKDVFAARAQRPVTPNVAVPQATPQPL